MNITYTRDELIKECLKTLKVSNITNAYIRIILTRGESELSLDPTQSKKNNLVIIVKPKPQHNQDFYRSGIKLKVVSILRNDSRSTNPEAKSGNYLNNVMAITEAKNLGFNDAIMLNSDQNITEGSSFNVWLIKSDIVFTPSANAGLLLGITREKIIEICNTNNIKLIIKDLTVQDVSEADEAFITSSTREVMPIGLIDDKVFDLKQNNTTKRLQALFKEFLLSRSNGLEY
jgi:branched-chain amino acid aminotransferase